GESRSTTSSARLHVSAQNVTIGHHAPIAREAMPRTTEYAATSPAAYSARRGRFQSLTIQGTMRNPPAWIAQNSMSAARQSAVPMGASQSAGLTATQANAAAIPTSGAAAAM